MNGVTGRMGLNQHLRRSVYAIMQQGGVNLGHTNRSCPSPCWWGAIRQSWRRSSGMRRIPWSTNLDDALANPEYSIYFDSQTTDRRAACEEAIAAGKHIYCEKPISDSLDVALDLLRLAKKAGVKHGVVQDKLWLPGMMKFQTLMELGLLRSHFRFAGSLATGYLKATRCRFSDRPGTIARKRAAASSSTCCATGAMCSIICSAT